MLVQNSAFYILQNTPIFLLPHSSNYHTNSLYLVKTKSSFSHWVSSHTIYDLSSLSKSGTT